MVGMVNGPARLLEPQKRSRAVHPGQLSVQPWLDAPVQAQICSLVPSAELAPVAARHLPEPVFTRRLFAPVVHAGAGVPLQSKICTLLPLAVPAAATSRH